MSMEPFNTSNSGLSKDKNTITESRESSSQPTITNLCIICSTRQRTVAFIPCGHFATCTPCGHSLKICPTCGLDIKALIRIYN